MPLAPLVIQSALARLAAEHNRFVSPVIPTHTLQIKAGHQPDDFMVVLEALPPPLFTSCVRLSGETL